MTCFMQVLYLGRAPRTKETLPDFLKWHRVTRPPLVFRGLTGSQQTPGFGALHHFSLRLRAIRPSEFFGTRRKVALRSKAYVWVPVLGVFDKLREVGISSYLSFTLCLSVFMMFELIEDVNGRLIGPKSWNRIVRKF